MDDPISTADLVQAPVSFLGKNSRLGKGDINKGDINPEVEECVTWLRVNGFANGHYSPFTGCAFEVLRPLESCGDGEGVPTLGVGTWKCVNFEMDNKGFMWAEFASTTTGGQSRLCVGRSTLGVHAIMAWKGNIKRER